MVLVWGFCRGAGLSQRCDEGSRSQPRERGIGINRDSPRSMTYIVGARAHEGIVAAPYTGGARSASPTAASTAKESIEDIAQARSGEAESPGTCACPAEALLFWVSAGVHDLPLLRIAVVPTAANGLRHPSQVMVDRAVSLPRSKVGQVFDFSAVGVVFTGHFAF